MKFLIYAKETTEVACLLSTEFISKKRNKSKSLKMSLCLLL